MSKRVKIPPRVPLTTKKEVDAWLHANCHNIEDCKYEIASDLTVSFKGDLNISNHNLMYIPVQFSVVSGKFDCCYNTLVSLEGSPHTVGGDFWCTRNRLKNLVGGPKLVKGRYFCDENNLVSLLGAPEVINNDFDCSINHLKNLKYGPKKVVGHYSCHRNKLVSLEGVPQELPNSLYAHKNKLKTMEFVSNEIGGDLTLNHNPLESFAFCPKKVSRRFEVSDTLITTIAGFTTEMEEGGYFYYKNTPIKELEDVVDAHYRAECIEKDMPLEIANNRLAYSELKVIVEALREKKELNNILPASNITKSNELSAGKNKHKI